MKASEDEALLLLNKWKSESSAVVALLALMGPFGHTARIMGFSARFTGRVRALDSLGHFSIKPDSGGDFLYASLAGAVFGFADSEPELVESLRSFLPEDWESVLFIRLPGDVALVLFPIE